MATFKDGYNGKELEIRVYSQSSNGSIEIWIKQDTLNDGKEFLAYATVDELYKLHREVCSAGLDLFE